LLSIFAVKSINIVELITFKSVIRRQYLYQQLVFLQHLCRVSSFLKLLKFQCEIFAHLWLLTYFVVVNVWYLSNQCLSLLRLGVRIPLMVKCARYNIIQLMSALKVNIIIVHPRVVFPRALARGKTTSQVWTIMMFTASAGINCFIILKLDAKQNW
jgi:hypothetical protein